MIDYRASLSNTFGQTVYLPIMFLVFGVTAGIVYWQAETPLQIMTAYCGSSIPSLLFMGSVLHKRINKNLEVSEKKNFFYCSIQLYFKTMAFFIRVSPDRTKVISRAKICVIEFPRKAMSSAGKHS